MGVSEEAGSRAVDVFQFLPMSGPKRRLLQLSGLQFCRLSL